MREGRWYTAQVYYYAEAKRDLLLDGIRPCLQKISAIAQRYFFHNHWFRGPHLKLYFYCTEEESFEQIKALLESDVQAYLRMHPSQASLVEEEVRPIYEHKARIERIAEPLFPLFPDNSIQYVQNALPDYQKRSDADLLSYQMLEDFYVDTNDITFAILEQVRQGKNILLQAFDLMVTTGHLLGRHIALTCDVYRTQAEACIRSGKDPEALQALFDKQYQTQEKVLCEHLSELLDALDFQEDTFLFTQDWDRIQQVYWRRLCTIAHYGREIDPHEVDEQQIDVFNRIQKNFNHNQWYQRYLPLLMLQHLFLERLGISPLNHFMLCYFIARTTEQMFQSAASH